MSYPKILRGQLGVRERPADEPGVRAEHRVAERFAFERGVVRRERLAERARTDRAEPGLRCERRGRHARVGEQPDLRPAAHVDLAHMGSIGGGCAFLQHMHREARACGLADALRQ